MAIKGIVIDPGHGGKDPGASGNDIVEKDLTLKISKYMLERFKTLGIPVSITRTTDESIDNSDRVKRIQDAYGTGSDVIVLSNHINAGGGEGAEVIYALRNSDALAKSIIDNLENSGQIVRKYYQRRLPSNPVKDYYFVIRDTPNNQTLLVEYGFLDNLNDANRLKENYEKYAESVVKAVTEYGGYKYTPIATGNEYIVKSGDTLWSIAKKYNISVDKLKDLNSLKSNSLSINQVLKVKETSVPIVNSNTYTVVKGDSLYSIARKLGISVNELMTLNSLNSTNLSIGQVLKIPSNEIYTVQKDDSLYAIAKKYNTTVDNLIKMNNLTNTNLSIGEQLIVS